MWQEAFIFVLVTKTFLSLKQRKHMFLFISWVLYLSSSSIDLFFMYMFQCPDKSISTTMWNIYFSHVKVWKKKSHSEKAKKIFGVLTESRHILSNSGVNFIARYPVCSIVNSTTTTTFTITSKKWQHDDNIFF